MNQNLHDNDFRYKHVMLCYSPAKLNDLDIISCYSFVETITSFVIIKIFFELILLLFLLFKHLIRCSS